MPNPLSPLLSRWELNPPAIHASEAYGGLTEVFAGLQSRSLVRPTTPAGAADCPDCSRRCRVEFVQDSSGVQRGYIHCRDCGLVVVPPQLLERWEIDTGALLAAIFRDVRLAIQQRVPEQLWQVGKATWAGRSREVWFARAFRRGHVDAAIGILSTRSKAIVFAPTETGAARWHEASSNLVIPLDATVAIDDDQIEFDVEFVEGRIIDAGMGSDSAPARPPQKRGGRAADIETLRNTMIEHLRAACDHAYATKEQHGEPRLLPRPTQKALGNLVGLSESKVSRCLKDPTGDELRLYWDMAEDLSQIMAFKGPINRGRRT